MKMQRTNFPLVARAFIIPFPVADTLKAVAELFVFADPDKFEEYSAPEGVTVRAAPEKVVVPAKFAKL